METSDIALIVGRFLLGGLFVFGGVKHFFCLDALTSFMKGRGVPAARFVLIAGSVYQTVFGALLVAGLYVPLACVALIVFTIVASAMFMNFWDMECGEARTNCFNGCMTNVALIGGLLIAASM